MLSLSMIVRNEEARLEACLKSVKNFVDEMVVVDTGSTDSTVSVAKAAGARVEHFAWTGDFAPARNSALSLVNGDWVLTMDADEQLRPEAIPSIRALMAQPDVLVINLLRHELGAVMSPYSSVSRLFRRHPCIQWSRPYHSMIDDSVRALRASEPHWRIADCREPALLHDGYRQEVLQSGDKQERLRTAMESWLKENPGDPYACAKLGGLEISKGDQKRGLALLKAGLENLDSKDDSPCERYELLFHLGIALAPNDSAGAEQAYRKAINLPLETRITLGARLNLAALLMKQSELDEAIALTKMATQAAPEVSLGWYNLGLMQRRRGDTESALLAYEKAKQLNPKHPETHQNDAVARLMGGDLDGARRGFRQALKLLNEQGRNQEAEGLLRQLDGMIKLDHEGR